MLRRTLLIAPAAAGLYALLLVTTGSVEVEQSRVMPVRGAFLAMTVGVPVVDLPIDQLPGVPDPVQPGGDPAPVSTPDPDPTLSSEATPVAPEPTPEVAAPVIATPPPASAGTGAGGDGGPGDGGGTQIGSESVSPGKGIRQPAARPQVERRERSGRPNAEARDVKIRRVAPSGRERGKHARTGGTPAASNSAGWLSSILAPIPIAIPDLVIDDFQIPPFLLPIYQAAAMQYGVRWEVLAAINEIETNYGRNLNVSSAGAMGWMQFMPATWEMYGVDANDDGRKDPSNPVDAIFAAARYLRAAGGESDIRKAIYAYNHADWYVDSVLERARAIGFLPGDLIDSLAGLAGGQFPVGAPATFDGEQAGADGGRRLTIEIASRAGAPAVAVNDGRVVQVARSERLGRFARLRDVYGNTYTYANLGASQVRRGTRVSAGATIGRLGGRDSARLLFEIRPPGPNAPRIDPKPILDGWKLLESMGIEDAGSLRSGTATPTIGQVVVMSSQALTQRLLADPAVDVYECGRADLLSGRIDRRVLATLEFLAASGLKPTVTSLRCGHSYLTASGNVSEHSTGTAVDIAAINGIPITGHQGAGSITEVTIQRLLTLQGTMKPHQIISLMTFEGADNTLAMGDHDDHIHVGFSPVAGSHSSANPLAVLEPGQWTRLIDRIAVIDEPVMRRIAPE